MKKYLEFVNEELGESNISPYIFYQSKERFYKVISTVISIIKEFIKEKDPRVLKINAIFNFRKDKRRKNIYIRYIERLLPNNYKYKKSFFGNSLYITKKIRL